MTRLFIHAEGETEEVFVNEILAPHLYRLGYTKVSARLLGNARQRDRRGGVRGWNSARKDILNHLKEDPGCLATTMVDYYGMPQDGQRAWPGRKNAARMAFEQRATCVEESMLSDICAELGQSFNPRRFVPYVMMHEFEGLLFSDCSGFSNGIGRGDLAPQFRSIRDAFDTPEEINDSPSSAPSKRVKRIMPNYEKPLHGALAVLEIGLDRIREECPHFRSWITSLEAHAA